MSRGRLTWLVAVLLGAAAYWGATRIGYAIAFVHGSVSAVWPPTGVALALVWIGGPRMLPAVFLGELTGDLTNGSPMLVSIAFACGSSAEALSGWALLRRVRFRAGLQRVRDVFALVGLTALISTMASATIGTVTLLIHGDISIGGAWATWHVWWLGDVTGDIVVAPLLLVAAGIRPRLPRGWRAVETIAFTATLAALGVIAHQLTLGIAYLVLPVLIWAALRFRQTGAVVANAVLAASGVIGAAGAASALARVSVLDRILFTQNFVAVGAITTLVLAALTCERNRATAALRHAQIRADELAAERASVAEIVSAVARQEPLEQVLSLLVHNAARLLDAAGARVVRAAAQDGGRDRGAGAGEIVQTRSGIPAQPLVAVPIRPAGEDWGRLEVHAPKAVRPYGDHGSLLVRLAGLAEQAVVNDRARRRLVAEATTDALTGLRNQRAFNGGMRDELERTRRYGRPLALVLIDLDSFKEINDIAGHPTGDLVLAEAAARVREAVRVEALVARLGGDELAILLPECDIAAAWTVAERVREAVSATPVVGRHRVTISAGIAELWDSDGGRELIAAADTALYAAKRMGGDTCVRHTPGMSAGGPAAFAVSPD